MSQRKWDDYFIRMARLAATMSKDSTKAGAVIATPDNRVVSAGYNGLPRGIMEVPQRRRAPEKYDWTVHAEENAILIARVPVEGCTLYSSVGLCHHCASAARQAGIARVVAASDGRELLQGTHWAESLERGQTVLLEAGIPYQLIDVPHERFSL